MDTGRGAGAYQILASPRNIVKNHNWSTDLTNINKKIKNELSLFISLSWILQMMSENSLKWVKRKVVGNFSGFPSPPSFRINPDSARVSISNIYKTYRGQLEVHEDPLVVLHP
jgi:hypothetical protein